MVLIVISLCSFIFGFFNADYYVGIFILSSEKPKQLGIPDGEFLLIAVNLFEESYVESFFFFLLQSTVPLLGRSKGSRLGISL